MDVYTFSLNKSDELSPSPLGFHCQHPGFVLRWPLSSHRCPQQLRMPQTDLTLLRQRQGVQPLTGLSLHAPWTCGTQSLNTAGTPLFSECQSLLGKSAGVEGSGCTHGKPPPVLSLARPTAVSRASFQPSPGLSLSKAWLTHGGTLRWEPESVWKGFQSFVSSFRFSKVTEQGT